jgi:hypothetical protein
MTDHLVNIENHLLQGFPEEIQTQGFGDHILITFEDNERYIVKKVDK